MEVLLMETEILKILNNYKGCQTENRTFLGLHYWF